MRRPTDPIFASLRWWQYESEPIANLEGRSERARALGLLDDSRYNAFAARQSALRAELERLHRTLLSPTAATNDRLHWELTKIWDVVNHDPEVRVIVVTCSWHHWTFRPSSFSPAPVAYLAGCESGYMAGASLTIDGGLAL